MLVDAPPFERIATELRSRLEGRIFIAHNVRFDYGFIRREFAAIGTPWSSPNLCTVKLSRALYPEMPRHNLDAVMERHGIVIAHRHRAMPDAQALVAFWRAVRAAWQADELQRALDLASLRVTLPAALSPDLPDDLPENPGVYRFFGVDEQGAETLLYVGKANNLRERVLDHFRGGTADAKALELVAQVRRVQWTETAGELGALLLEAREVRETHPVYNRPPRGGSRFTWWFSDDPVPPTLVEIDAEVLRSGNAFGSYRCERDGRRALESLAREHKWCLKMLGLETGPGSCFSFQMGRCTGPCAGKEPVKLHLMRVKIGMLPQRLKPWPHKGPVVVREGVGERQELHVIDAWQHVATFDAGCAEQLADLIPFARRRQGAFDIASYRILTRFMRDTRHAPLALG
jgi:DNA polymerase-3 subunit epsilon